MQNIIEVLVEYWQWQIQSTISPFFLGMGKKGEGEGETPKMLKNIGLLMHPKVVQNLPFWCGGDKF